MSVLDSPRLAERAGAPAPAELVSVVDYPWWRKGRIPGLDGLRAVSILAVIFCHACYNKSFPFWVPPTLVPPLGQVGVDVFFTVSGFLITLLLIREREASGAIGLRAFYRRRVLRIVPAYLAYMLFVLAGTRWLGTVMRAKDWLLALTYTSNLAGGDVSVIVEHSWSLSIEEHFYLFWPVLVVALGFRRAGWVAAGLLVLQPILRVSLLKSGFPLEAYARATPLRIDTILAGCLLALMLRNDRLRRHLAADNADRWFLAGTGLLAASILIFRVNTPLATAAFELTLRSLAIGILVIGCVGGGRWSSRLLEWSPVVWLGTLSYSLYLWQQPFVAPGAVWPDAAIAFPLNIGIAFACALGSHYLIERPFLRLKDRLGRAERSRG